MAMNTSHALFDAAQQNTPVARRIDTATADFDNHFPRTQSISLSSDGTTTFAPTWQAATPTMVTLQGLDASANTMIDASMTPTVLTATGITLEHGTAAAAHSALATIFYT